jgi:hypothetical protein
MEADASFVFVRDDLMTDKRLARSSSAPDLFPDANEAFATDGGAPLISFDELLQSMSPVAGLDPAAAATAPPTGRFLLPVLIPESIVLDLSAG